MCHHQSATLEEAVVLMESYASAEAGAYLIPSPWKGHAGNNHRGRAQASTQEGDETEKHGWLEGRKSERFETARHEWQKERWEFFFLFPWQNLGTR